MWTTQETYFISTKFRLKSKQSYTQPHIAKSVPSCFNKSIIQVIICIKLINRHCENINPTGFLTIIMDFHLEFHMPHSSVHVLSVIIRRKLFIKFYSFWSWGKKKKGTAARGSILPGALVMLVRQECARSWRQSRGTLLKQQGPYRGPSQAADGHVFLHKEDLWWDLDSELVRVSTGVRRAAFTLRTQILLLIPEEFVGFQTHLIPTVMNKSHACVDQQQTLLSLSFSCSRLHFTVPKKVYKFYLDLPRKLHASDQDLDYLWCCSVNIVWRAQEAHRKHAVLYM